MSIQGVHAAGRPWNARVEEQLTILGWYERLRLARYFDEPTLQRLSEPGEEFRLRQGADGRWRFTPAHLAKHRISAMGNGSERWATENPFAAQPLRARIEALYSVAPYDGEQAVPLADFADLDAMTNRRNAPGVTAHIEVDTENVKAGGRSLRFRAANAGDASFAVRKPRAANRRGRRCWRSKSRCNRLPAGRRKAKPGKMPPGSASRC